MTVSWEWWWCRACKHCCSLSRWQSCAGTRSIGRMVWHPTVLNRGLFKWCFVCLVVQPPIPLCWYHACIIVYTMLGVVDDPPVPAIEILVILKIFVSIFVLSNKLSSLQIICPVQVVQSTLHPTMILDNLSKFYNLVQAYSFHQSRHPDLISLVEVNQASV